MPADQTDISKMPLPGGETIDLTSRAVETYNRLGLDCLVCLGGNGTHKVAHALTKHGLNIIGLPKTIDNDLEETDITFGFDSAVTTAAQAIDRLYSTAEAHLRVMIIELMGHNAGWLALNAGLAGGADIILLPEIPYDIESICQHLTRQQLQQRAYHPVSKPWSILGSRHAAPGQSDQPTQVMPLHGFDDQPGAVGLHLRRGPLHMPEHTHHHL